MLGESNYLRDKQIFNFAYYMPIFDLFRSSYTACLMDL